MTAQNFAISWIYEDFVACRISRGKIAAHWVSPDPVPDLAAFNQAVVNASANLHMHNGGDVAITYESDEHAHVFLDLPPMPRKDLERHLELRSEQEKSFEEEAVWSYRDVEHDDHSAGVMLHLMPKRVLDAMIRICQENHIVPLRIKPLTDIMVQHIPTLNLDVHEVILVVALFESRVEFVVATAKGEALFVRELKYHWREDQLERLGVDIERTSLYIKQRQKNITRAIIMGAEAESAMAAIASKIPFPVEAPEFSADPLFWCREVGNLGNLATSNFIPRSMQRAVACSRAVRSASWLAYAAVAAALIVTVAVEFLVWQQQQADPELFSRIEQLEMEYEQLSGQSTELIDLQQRIEQFVPSHPPIPAWFLSRLGEVVPDEAILSAAGLRYLDGTWSFSIEGATSPTLAASARTVAQIENTLASKPWRATVSDEWRAEWIEMLRNGRAAETGLIDFRLRGALGQ